MERDQFSLDTMFDGAADWSLTHLPLNRSTWGARGARSTPLTHRLLPACEQASA